MNAAKRIKHWRALLAIAVIGITAAAPEDDFIVADVWFERIGDGVAPRADLVVRQTERMRDILQVGYKLQLLLELRFLKRREWWFDEEIGNINWLGVLSYDAYSKRYLLSIDDNTRRFKSLAGAIQTATQLRAQPSSAPRFIAIFEQHDIYLNARFSMPVGNLPEPIQIDLLVDDEWDTGGVWITLPLRIEPQP